MTFFFQLIVQNRGGSRLHQSIRICLDEQTIKSEIKGIQGVSKPQDTNFLCESLQTTR